MLSGVRHLSRSTVDEALEHLVAVSSSSEHGYVHLQKAPYRTHHLIAALALQHSHQGSIVFEGGVSSGYFAKVLARAGRVVDGSEVDPNSAAEARSVCRHVWEGDIGALSSEELDGPYDLLVFGDTLEHLADPVATLRQLADHTAPGGHLVVSVPNIANWAMRLNLLLGRFDYTDRGILDRTHLRFFTVRSLAELAVASGFEPIVVTASTPVPFVRNRRVARWFFALGDLRPSFFGYGLVMVARLATSHRTG